MNVIKVQMQLVRFLHSMLSFPNAIALSDAAAAVATAAPVMMMIGGSAQLIAYIKTWESPIAMYTVCTWMCVCLFICGRSGNETDSLY